MSEKHICPVCGKYEFEEYDSFDFCPVCRWIDDAGMTRNPELRGYYKMNLTEARTAYAVGIKIEYFKKLWFKQETLWEMNQANGLCMEWNGMILCASIL